MTKKQLIVDYVDRKDGATYTEIIKFIYEHNHGKDTFDPVENRGYYSGAFSKMCRHTGYDGRYLLKGDGLTKIDKMYYATRRLGKTLEYGDITNHLLDWVFDNGPVSYTDIDKEYRRYSGSNSFSYHLPNLSNSNTTRPCTRYIIKDTSSGPRGLYTLDSNYNPSLADQINEAVKIITDDYEKNGIESVMEKFVKPHKPC
jgi:hypothetical protein